MTNTNSSQTQPSAATTAEEDKEAHAPHVAAWQSGKDEAAAPDSTDPDVAEHYEDMAKKGAHVKGEGELP